MYTKLSYKRDFLTLKKTKKIAQKYFFLNMELIQIYLTIFYKNTITKYQFPCILCFCYQLFPPGSGSMWIRIHSPDSTYGYLRSRSLFYYLGPATRGVEEPAAGSGQEASEGGHSDANQPSGNLPCSNEIVLLYLFRYKRKRRIILNKGCPRPPLPTI